MKKIDVILSTYNWPEALERTLYGFTQQTLKDFRIIIADDGSNEATAALIKKISQQSDLEIIHCWQEDKGFRKARILNKAVKLSNARQLIFTDQDAIPHYDFVKEHNKRFVKGCVLVGGYVRLTREYTEKLTFEKIANHDFVTQVTKKRQRTLLWKHIKSIFYINNPLHNHRPSIMGLNFSVDRLSFLKINGYDIKYEGWGQEDSDLATRLWNARIPYRSFWNKCLVFHQWHPQEESKNLKLNRNYYKRKKIACICESGFSQTAFPVILNTNSMLLED
jgi:glycosyltransferase involved in cell wall biosynthesis